jgi:cytochrome b6
MNWLDERIGGDALHGWMREKMVPVHRHTVWYYFGGMTLFLFAVQVVTGILLLLYYRPTAESAFESVQFIMAEVQFGWLIRSLHSWSANLMILTLFIHMASVSLTRAYARPREITWLTISCPGTSWHSSRRKSERRSWAAFRLPASFF